MANEIDFEFNGLDSNAIDNRIKEELENCCEGSMVLLSFVNRYLKRAGFVRSAHLKQSILKVIRDLFLCSTPTTLSLCSTLNL